MTPEHKHPSNMMMKDGLNVGNITSHVFLSLVHNKRVAAVRLWLLVGLLMGMGVADDADLFALGQHTFYFLVGV